MYRCIEAGSRVSLADSNVLISRTVAGFMAISGWMATILAGGIAVGGDMVILVWAWINDLDVLRHPKCVH